NPAANLLARWVREGDWKLIDRTPAGGKVRASLYNLKDDPFEMKDLAMDQPERVKQLQTLLDEWWKP
ncbi:MAG: sulfatase, partial [Planctomycetes bacterium]|nr:sulfatase [Planctomycetota bacterium]